MMPNIALLIYQPHAWDLRRLKVGYEELMLLNGDFLVIKIDVKYAIEDSKCIVGSVRGISIKEILKKNITFTADLVDPFSKELRANILVARLPGT